MSGWRHCKTFYDPTVCSPIPFSLSIIQEEKNVLTGKYFTALWNQKVAGFQLYYSFKIHPPSFLSGDNGK